MLVFHRTDRAEAILAGGFRDGEGTYMTGELHRGVWVSSGHALDINEGAEGDAVLVVEIPEAEVSPFEWIEDFKTYREFLVPADVLNAHRVERLWTCDGCDATARTAGTLMPLDWQESRGLFGSATVCPSCAP